MIVLRRITSPVVMLASLLCLSLNSAWASERIRVATYNTELQRKGPGLLYRDILDGTDAQVLAVVDVLKETKPDIVALQGFDYDLTGLALTAFADLLRNNGVDYPYVFATRPNTGMATGLDMNGDGYLGDPEDAQSFGQFSGQAGMAILSRFPILETEVEDFSELLWVDFEGALLPEQDGRPFPSQEAQDIQRLSNVGHWVVPVIIPEIGRVNLLTFHATPPVFDGPEDRNGRRNHDEIMFWVRYLNEKMDGASKERFVLLGDANQDPLDGEGRKEAINMLLSHPLLQDPRPSSPGSVASTGDPHDTVDWPDPTPGNLRVDYVLPSQDWQILDQGTHWPLENATVATASRHFLVWVDLGLRISK